MARVRAPAAARAVLVVDRTLSMRPLLVPAAQLLTWPASWQSMTLDIPAGPNVTTMIGEGSTPTPNGGGVTSGSYWLVAETVYGDMSLLRITIPSMVFPARL